ncbi:MAG: fructose-bisphosphate aldolase [Candidatus Dormibacteria bacterium]|jgi:DhnA family fructose-bisphosphate aldolase class Ia
MTMGAEIRLGRLFDEGRNAVVVAVDHGLYNGPLAGLNDLPVTLRDLGAADAILMSPGMAAHVGHLFAHRGAPALMIRLNWGTQYASQWQYHESRSVPVLTAAEAVALGADIVLVGMSIHTGSEAVDAENVEMVARAVSQKRAAGVPIVGEVYPADQEDLPADERHERIAVGCRVVAELGVDLVKTFYTGERFGEIIAATPIPVLALGSRKLPREVDALKLAAEAIHSGAHGVVFGRNVLQARDPKRFLAALCAVVKEATPPEVAADRCGLIEAVLA